jgi:hypothetical protein
MQMLSGNSVPPRLREACGAGCQQHAPCPLPPALARSWWGSTDTVGGRPQTCPRVCMRGVAEVGRSGRGCNC